jgi:hypothetical protein
LKSGRSIWLLAFDRSAKVLYGFGEAEPRNTQLQANTLSPFFKGEETMPPLVCCQLAALTIAGLFYVWRDVLSRKVRDSRLLRERVTYMLWVAANK